MEPLAATCCVLLLRKLLIQAPTLPPIRIFSSFALRILWSTLLNALAKSRYIVSKSVPDSIDLITVSTCPISWERVDLPLRKPCWFDGSRLFSSRCLMIAFRTILSKILMMWDVREIGRYDLAW